MARQIQHLLPDQVYGFLHTRQEGLNPSEVSERLAEVGPNALRARSKTWWTRSLVRQFTNFFSILLDLSALICFVADRIQPGQSMGVLGWALLGVSVLNALFSFAQEYRAERAMDELRKFLPQKVTVRRGGQDVEIMAEELVPGDVLILREGDRVPADARLVACEGVLVSNAPLTGESRPISLEAGAAEAALLESPNLAFAGSSVLRGSGLGVVFATGFRTEFGKIASLSQDIRRSVSPLERETGHMVWVLTVIATVMGVGFFLYGVFSGRSLWINLVFMMGIIVANVPEGLLPTFTLSLAMGSLRMARRNVLVKSLNAVEALGAVHVICTDKTGTLTLNRLAITQLADAVTGDDVRDAEAVEQILEAALIASEVRVEAGAFTGDPLDVAIAELYRQQVGPVEPAIERVLHHFPFDVEKRRASGVAGRGEGRVFCIKGAWESIKPMIGWIRVPGRSQPIEESPGRLSGAEAVVHKLASRGARVITVAYRHVKETVDGGGPPDAADLERELVLLGFLSLEDPIRPEVPAAVESCRRAGIRVVMITGDHPDTAEAVARRAGIVAGGGRSAIITGDELERLREQQLIERLNEGVCVFARATPEQKMKIVSALHEMDLVVAVTGDGVNDAPALKAADVGVAMGRGGTDVARESAQVILLDDNFASIVAGIEEGRTIFANIRKFTNYVLVSNGPEILPYLIYILFPVPLALTVIQILSIDLGTDIIPSMGLGQEPPEEGVMNQPPRDRRQGLLTLPLILHSYGFLGLFEAVFSLTLFFWVLVSGGWAYGQDLADTDSLYRAATGLTLSSIILMQIGNLLGRRSRYGLGVDWRIFTNPFVLAGIGLEIFFSWAILYVPVFNRVLGTGPVDPRLYAVAWLGVPLIFGFDYLRKIVARRVARYRGA